MMNKKGVVWSTIIYAIIAIIVLIVIVLIFREQITDIYETLMGIVKTTTSEADTVNQGFKDLIKPNE